MKGETDRRRDYVMSEFTANTPTTSFQNTLPLAIFQRQTDVLDSVVVPLRFGPVVELELLERLRVAPPSRPPIFFRPEKLLFFS